MPFFAAAPTPAPLANLDSTPTYSLSYSGKSAAYQGLSPIGQPTFDVKAGIAQADTLCYLIGIDAEVPLSAGVHVLSVRGDFDLWQHINTSSGGSGGGTDFAVDAIFGPSGSYFGAGLALASRFDGASGPSGLGIKVMTGARFASIVGYEVAAIISQKGAMADAVITLHL